MVVLEGDQIKAGRMFMKAGFSLEPSSSVPDVIAVPWIRAGLLSIVFHQRAEFQRSEAYWLERSLKRHGPEVQLPQGYACVSQHMRMAHTGSEYRPATWSR